MRRALRILSVSLITAGIVVLADVGLTLVWKEPLSTVYGAVKQGQAEEELIALSARFPTEADLRAVADRELEAQVAALARDFGQEVEAGKGIGRIAIDAIDLDMVVVEGTGTEDLRKGPGHYTEAPSAGFREAGDGSAFPGEGKTVGIAGHRTTYAAPFRRLDELEEGDEIVLEMPYATFTYAVERTRVVSPTDIGVVRNVGRERLVLTACHPLYSAAQRIVAFARLVSVDVADAAAEG